METCGLSNDDMGYESPSLEREREAKPKSRRFKIILGDRMFESLFRELCVVLWVPINLSGINFSIKCGYCCFVEIGHLKLS
jgi:hypothetical protein